MGKKPDINSGSSMRKAIGWWKQEKSSVRFELKFSYESETEVSWKDAILIEATNLRTGKVMAVANLGGLYHEITRANKKEQPE